MTETERLQRIAADRRKDLLCMIRGAHGGHTGGALSSTDILVALHYHTMNLRPDEPTWPDRDRFILSKGHSVEGYYAILADLGYFPREELQTYGQFGTRLISHPSVKVPGIEMNTGALGHGLPVAVGMALGQRMNGSAARTFVLMGDGEQAEGSVWEAAMSAAHYHLDNLVAILDRNGLQISGSTEEVMALEPLAEKYCAFGWTVAEVDGHDFEALTGLLDRKPHTPGKPLLILAHTIKGKGVSFMQHVAKWHHGVPDEAQYELAMQELDGAMQKLDQAVQKPTATEQEVDES